MDELSAELEAPHLIGHGHETRHIAAALHRSVKTIETYRSRIKTKPDLKNPTALAQTARTGPRRRSTRRSRRAVIYTSAAARRRSTATDATATGTRKAPAGRRTNNQPMHRTGPAV